MRILGGGRKGLAAVVLLSLGTIVALAGCGASSPATTKTSSSGAAPAASRHYVLKIATWGAPSTPQVADFVPEFTKLVQAGSHGAIKVQNFPAGGLVQEQSMPTAIPSDVADIGLTTVGTWQSVVPLSGIVSAVFFSPTYQNFEKVAGPGTPAFQALDKAFRQHGIKLLSLHNNGPTIYASSVPLTTPQAFHGKTVRVFDRPGAQLVKALGGAPATIDLADVYPALQRGTVTAANGGLQGAIGLKEYQVAKYLLDPNGAFGTLVVGYVMNLRKYESLPAKLRAVVMHAATVASGQLEAKLATLYSQQLQEMRTKGMHVTVLQPGSSQYKAFQSAVSSLIHRQEASYPHSLVQTILHAEG